ncbi:MAG: DUF2239 family protein [Deltaproteobacteria bacterium]|nr:DUF2239 family protein [Deltaproteobacteria bacterium]
MNEHNSTYTVLVDYRRLIHTGADLTDVTAQARGAAGQTVMVFQDATGRYTEVDATSTAEELAAHFGVEPPREAGPGRPKLGVVRGEVTLLPRHWAWLKSQPGGASVTLRRLVDEARRVHQHRDRARQAKDAVARVVGLCAGEQPQVEALTRDLYADRYEEAVGRLSDWSEDLRAYVTRLLREAQHAHAMEEEAPR